MKQHLKKIFTIVALFSASLSIAHAFVPRSQSVNAARELAGWEHEVNKADMDDLYGTFALTLEGGTSFRSKAIAQCLFGDDVCCDDCPRLVISGSQVANRGANDWLADYFGLPTDYQSVVSFDPFITNLVADLNLYVGLDNILNGLFFRVHAPLHRTIWRLNMREDGRQGMEANYPAGYWDNSSVPAIYSSFIEAVSGDDEKCTPRTRVNSGDAGTFFYPLENCKFPVECCDCPNFNRKRTGLADLRAMLGWNFFNTDDYHVGLGLIVAAPTGNQHDPEFIFNPLVGNGHHVEVGGHLTSHYTFWRNEDETRSFGLYVDLNVTHLFEDCQRRCFDLCKAGQNSKYILAQKLRTVATSTNPSGYEFDDQYTQVANLTTRNVDVSVSWQVDFAALFNYTTGPLSLGLGYNFWGRACEDYDCVSTCGMTIAENTWALKGDAFTRSTVNEERLSATQSCATINSGTNKNQLANDDNPNVDNRAVLDGAGNSNPPVFLKESDLDLDSAKTKGRSHKLFSHATYRWEDWKDSWAPYVSIGTEIEWGNSDDCCDTDCKTTSKTASCNTACKTDCKTDCDDCQNCALSQWGIWFKGGVSFS